MACSLTIEQVRAQTKTVTRRHARSWQRLRVGQELLLVEKAMGLPKGSHQVVLARVEVTELDARALRPLERADLVAEGFPDADPEEWALWWEREHLFVAGENPTVRVIGWRYLTAPQATCPHPQLTFASLGWWTCCACLDELPGPSY